MQGGVCYNRAVPLAMAALTGRSIIVPPDPGLMGAFGVALEIKRRLALGLMQEQSFSLDALRDRELRIRRGPSPATAAPRNATGSAKSPGSASRERPTPSAAPATAGTTCAWPARPMRTASISSVPGSGLIFDGKPAPAHQPGTVGFNKSFFTDTFFPLYRQFFEELGFAVVLPDKIRQEGVDRKGAAFCYPAEISHGFLEDLLTRKIDWLFLPHFKGTAPRNGNGSGNGQGNGNGNGRAPVKSITCPISQGEPYYLGTAFKHHAAYRALKKAGRILSPVIDFSKGYAAAEGAFLEAARALGRTVREGRQAYTAAVNAQKAVAEAVRQAGRKALEELESDPGAFGVVVFGRSYNAFVSEAHMGIPQKFATRGIRVIPIDMLPLDDEPVHEQMYWSAGQAILKAASLVERHPQLFGCYIANFSCGPDSFLLGFFRDIMGGKPSLTLELDSHVADAGLETRIEAFLGIVKAWRELKEGRLAVAAGPLRSFTPSRFDYRNQRVIDSRGKEHSFFDPRVHLLFPSMGRFNSEALSASFRGIGVHCSCLPAADEKVLECGKGHTLCKECLPLQLVTGGLLKYLEGRKHSDELLLYVMPTTSGPCRFGQYAPFIEGMVEKLCIPDVALFSLSGENSYSDFQGSSFTKKAWTAVVLADVMQDVYSMLLACAADRPQAMEVILEGVVGHPRGPRAGMRAPGREGSAGDGR